MNALAGTRRAPAAHPRSAAASHEHALFKRHPLDGEAHTSLGPVPTPYHVYDGRGIFIGGSADLAAVRQLLAPEQVKAVQTEAGRALMGLWVFDFTDASLGPHHELQLSLFVSQRELAPVPAHRLGLIELMLTRPDVQMLCHGLWNSTPGVVAYNRELLALDARLSTSRIEQSAKSFGFAVHDTATRAPVVEGRIGNPQRASLRASFGLMARLGLRRLMALARQPWISLPVLNPVGPRLARNAAAATFTKADRNVIRRFDPQHDHLAVTEPRYQRLHFEPQFVQFMDGFKFVYLFPS